jgi:hypothetical protein
MLRDNQLTALAALREQASGRKPGSKDVYGKGELEGGCVFCEEGGGGGGGGRRVVFAWIVIVSGGFSVVGAVVSGVRLLVPCASRRSI